MKVPLWSRLQKVKVMFFKMKKKIRFEITIFNLFDAEIKYEIDEKEYNR